MATTVFLDNFVEASPPVALLSHTPDTGTNWTRLAGSTSVWTINPSGECELTTFDNTGQGCTNRSVFLANPGPSLADYTVTATIKILSLPFDGIVIFGRFASSTAFYKVIWYPWAPELDLQKALGGGPSTTQIGTTASGVSGSIGETHTIALVMTGSLISVLFDGVTKIGPITDTDFAAAGQAAITQEGGVAASDLIGFHFTQFKVESADPPNLIHVTQELAEVSYSAAVPNNAARTTQELLEVSYSAAVPANAIRSTQEIAEVSYSSAPPVDTIHFTQQTVEVLWLDRLAEAEFDPCGNFAGAEWEARLYTKAGKRKALASGSDWMRAIDEISFEITERGGCGSGTLQLMEEWDKIGLDGTEYVDVYLFGQRVYRGWLQIAQRDLAAPQRSSPSLYGLINHLNGYMVRRKYAYGSTADDAYSGCDVDVSTVFRAILEDHAQVTDRFPNLVISTEVIGVTLREFDARGQSVAQALNRLCDLSPNSMIWTADVTSGGLDRVSLKRRATETRYGFAVGDNVTALVYPLDTGQIVNKIKIKGGKVKQPNLLGNGSFEDAAGASDLVANLLLDNSFEDNNALGVWTLGGGATIKKAGADATAVGSARTGNRWLEIDTPGEYGEQTVKIDYRKFYYVFFWTRREATAACAVALEVELLNSASAIVATVSSGNYIDPGSDVYKLRGLTAAPQAHPDVTQLRVRAKTNGGTASNDGVLVDDVTVVEACGVGQNGWRTNANGTAYVAGLDWANTDIEPFHGGYCIKVTAAGTSDLPNTTGAGTLDIYTPKASYVSVKPNERYTVLGYWQTNSEGETTWELGYTPIKSDGSQGTAVIVATSIGNVNTWQLASGDIQTASDTAQVQVFLRIKENSTVFFDAFMLVEGEIPDDALNHGGYWEGDSYERTIDVTDSLLSGMLDADVATSITTYGLNDTDVSNSLVLDRTRAVKLAAGYFNAHAVPTVLARLTLTGIRRAIGLDGKVRVVNLPDPPPALVPARVRYSIGEFINAEVDLSSEVPDLAVLLRDVAAG